jgi:hypothetical protein
MQVQKTVTRAKVVLRIDHVVTTTKAVVTGVLSLLAVARGLYSLSQTVLNFSRHASITLLFFFKCVPPRRGRVF